MTATMPDAATWTSWMWFDNSPTLAHLEVNTNLSLAVGLGNMLAKNGMKSEMRQLISKVCARLTELQPSNVAQEAQP